MLSRENIKNKAIEICEKEGFDPFTTWDIDIPNDPDAIYAWANYREKAKQILLENKNA